MVRETKILNKQIQDFDFQLDLAKSEKLSSLVKGAGLRPPNLPKYDDEET